MTKHQLKQDLEANNPKGECCEKCKGNKKNLWQCKNSACSCHIKLCHQSPDKCKHEFCTGCFNPTCTSAICKRCGFNQYTNSSTFIEPQPQSKEIKPLRRIKETRTNGTFHAKAIGEAFNEVTDKINEIIDYL